MVAKSSHCCVYFEDLKTIVDMEVVAAVVGFGAVVFVFAVVFVVTTDKFA